MGIQKGAGESRGQSLKRLRESKGLSLEEVSQATKIHTRVLKALEGDTLAEISPAYVKGLLKIYCTYLGADPKDFIQQPAKKEQPVKQEEASGSPEDKKKEPLMAKPEINIGKITRQIKLKPIIKIIGLLVLLMIVIKLGRVIFNRPASHKKALPKAVAAKPRAAVAKKQQTSSSVPTVNEPRLGIRAKEDCWLQVKIDGKTIFKGVLKKGYFEQWEAKQLIELSLGNAAGVDVELNGERLPPLGRRGQVIKNIRITKQGLKIPK